MKRKALIAVFMVGIMISSSFLVLSNLREPPRFTVLDSSFRIINSPGYTSSNMHYTMYVPSNPFSFSVIKQELVQIGIEPDISGNLWTFSVPSQYSPGVSSLLQNISSEFHASFFSSPNLSLAYPSIQPMGNPQTSNIPFAYTPALIARAYNFTWALNHGINGKGQTIVVVDAYGDPNIAYDMKAFDAVSGLPPVNLTIEYPYGTPGEYNATWAMETATDVEWTHALAPGANIILLVAASSYTNYLQQIVSYAVQNRLGGIISLSWGTPESQLNANAAATYSKIYKNAASEGIDIFAASGDLGAYAAGNTQLTVSYPASDPWVTGVGGTSLYVLNNIFHQYGWGGVNNGKSYGSGGGYSTYFKTPYWQDAKGYNSTMRGVPDVAMDADKYTGVYVISNGGQYTVGGTSVSTPMWADVAALVRQYDNISLDSMNPLLYQIARSPLYTNSFSQIESGTNGYYNNSPGWNPVTGLGTPSVSGLLNDTRGILKGYGANVIFNGEANFNATSVRGNLNLKIDQGNLDRNGSTFYYLGFYGGNYSSVKFGVLVNSSGEQLMLHLMQSNTSVYRFYNMPSGYVGNLSGFSIGLSYTGSSITFSTSGGFGTSIPAFLDFSGSMSPQAGAEQIGSETNMTMINSARFSSLQTSYNSSWTGVTSMMFEPYSYFNSPSFSTIDSSFSGNALNFFSSSSQAQGYLNGSASTSPEVMYGLSYGYPLKATFSIPGVTAPVQWAVNGTALPGSVFNVPVSGGEFAVNATYTDSKGIQVPVSRTIFLPGMMQSNVSLNYSLPGYSTVPDTTLATMWFYSFTYTPSLRIAIPNATYDISVKAKGFHPLGAELNPSANISLTLNPVPVNVTVFVFNGNSTVHIENSNITSHNGYFYDEVLPTSSLSVNVSSKGFLDSNFTYAISPGQNFSDQVTLEPVNLNASMISGTVTDYLYSFPLNDAFVRISSSSSYTNSTGSYVLFADTGRYTINATSPLYDSYSSPLNVTSNMVLNIQLKPSKISLQTTAPVNITHYFPLLFYFGFISWSDYKGGNFSLYQIYVSNQPDFLNPSITTISSQNTSYAFLTGLVPGHSYYISIVLRLSNSQVYQSQVVKISYSDPVYLTINIILAGAIGFYAYIAYRIFRKKS